MESNKYLEDIVSIKSMMSKSSRFMSLSGLSGILAGIYALIGALVAHNILTTEQLTSGGARYASVVGLINAYLAHPSGAKLFLVGCIVLMAAVVTGIILTIRKAKKHEEKIWDPSSRRLLIHFSIPLFTGGVFCVVLLQYGLIGLVAPCTLIFYGLALINASKFTLGDIKYLGLANVIIGLVSTQYIGYGLYFWALGFGVFHIIYGTKMYLKHDMNKK
ncbi:hypothetical protein [uncultured Dokdonia sp.]|uniref:hypothetical protein n=1 Tax=uncultured Dokdonia sp. TaxID=575653 RepID=UPI00260D8E83|nr:hypothetical protein [uncultured Dokdonia sp.]